MADHLDPPDFVTEGRWRLLHNVARGAEPPADLSEYERGLVEDLKREMAEHPGAAFEIPID